MYECSFLQTRLLKIPNVSVDQKTGLSIYFEKRGRAFETLSQAFETLYQTLEGVRES